MSTAETNTAETRLCTVCAAPLPGRRRKVVCGAAGCNAEYNRRRSAASTASGSWEKTHKRTAVLKRLRALTCAPDGSAAADMLRSSARSAALVLDLVVSGKCNDVDPSAFSVLASAFRSIGNMAKKAKTKKGAE